MMYMIKIVRQDKKSVNMTFDRVGNDKLISAFEAVLNGQSQELDISFDLSVINMKKANLQLKSVTIVIDNSIKSSVFYNTDNGIIWAIDEEDADYALFAFIDCKENGCFFPAEFIRLQMAKNKNIDDMYCELVDSDSDAE